MLCLEGTGHHHSVPGVYGNYCKDPSNKKSYDECVPMLILMSSQFEGSHSAWHNCVGWAMARITVEELAYANDTWQQTYMSTMVTAKVPGTVEMKNDYIPTIDAPFIHYLHHHDSSLCMQMSKGISEIAACLLLLGKYNCRTNKSHQLTWGIMATSTYGDLDSGSRRVGMMFRNLSAWQIRISTKTIL